MKHWIRSMFRRIAGAVLIPAVTAALPAGYVRCATTGERRMPGRMAEDCDADPVCMLDMYRHGKAGWMLDLGLRLAVCLVASVIVWGIKRAVSNRKLPVRGE